MNSILFKQAVFIDTSAVKELEDSKGEFHLEAHQFAKSAVDFVWVALNATTHESYTRIRYDHGPQRAIHVYDWLRGPEVTCVPFDEEDEKKARIDLDRFKSHKLSFHDALLAAVMKRLGAYRVFSFDHHFYLFGFEVLPGSNA